MRRSTSDSSLHFNYLRMFTGLYTGVDKYIGPRDSIDAALGIFSAFLWTSNHSYNHRNPSYTGPLTLSLKAPCLIHHLINMGQDLPSSIPTQYFTFIHRTHTSYSYSDGSGSSLY
ncbi:MAG: hypothetical protein LZF60_270062 [Nitrospira sp.]|nr:MAG: hypothetical protein LZF60_270062 [Nitrospira sp.]